VLGGEGVTNMPSWLGGSGLALIAACAILLMAAVVAFTAGSRARAEQVAMGQSYGARETVGAQSREGIMAAGTFATAIACMDGRVQEPVASWLKQQTGVDYVDTVTIPGADWALTQGHEERKGHVHEYVTISVDHHGSRVIAVAGHQRCAAYDVSDAGHIASIREAVGVVANWAFSGPVRVVGLWVYERDGVWVAEQVADTAEGAA
jgi:hypothetical protein